MLKKNLVEKIVERSKNMTEVDAATLIMLRRAAKETGCKELNETFINFAKANSDDYACLCGLIYAYQASGEDSDKELAMATYNKLLANEKEIDTTCVCTALSVLPGYIQSETKLGKKEHYQHVAARFVAATEKFLGGEENVKDAATLMLAQVATLEVMSQQMFEHYMSIVDNFKAVLSFYKDKLVEADEESKLNAAYAINRANDLRIILEEKYDGLVEALLK